MASKPWENAGQMAVPFGHQPQSKPDWSNQEMDEDGFAITQSNTGPHQTMQMQPGGLSAEVQLPTNQPPQPQLDGFQNGSLKGGARDFVRSYDADPDPYNPQAAAFAQPGHLATHALQQDTTAVQGDQDRGWQHPEAFDPREAYGPQLQQASGSGSGSGDSNSKSKGGLALDASALGWVGGLCIVVSIIIAIYVVVGIVNMCNANRSRGGPELSGRQGQGRRLFDMRY